MLLCVLDSTDLATLTAKERVAWNDLPISVAEIINSACEGSYCLIHCPQNLMLILKDSETSGESGMALCEHCPS